MKALLTSHIIVLLALSIVHTGFAQAERLLCQNKCEQSQQAGENIPPCCSDKMADSHSLMQAGGHNMNTPDCPHVDSTTNISDPLPLLTVSTVSPEPDTLPAFSGIILSPLFQLHPAGPAVRPERTGLPPPGLAAPPYHLFCSLLI